MRFSLRENRAKVIRLGYVFQNQARFLECQDTITLQEHFLPLWETSPCHTPASINVSLTHLLAMPNLDLFSPSDESWKTASASPPRSTK